MLYEPVKPVGPVLPHDLGAVITTARVGNFLAVDELKKIREGKGETREMAINYLRVVCENIEGELQEINDRLAGHSRTAQESRDEGLETETNDFDKGVHPSGRFPFDDGDNERSSCRGGRGGKKEDA